MVSEDLFLTSGTTLTDRQRRQYPTELATRSLNGKQEAEKITHRLHQNYTAKNVALQISKQSVGVRKRSASTIVESRNLATAEGSVTHPPTGFENRSETLFLAYLKFGS